MMQHRARLIAVVALTGAAACGGGRSNTPSTSQTNTVPPASAVQQTPMSATNTVVDTVTPRHHSKLAGAALGAAAGHALGGHAVLGAAAGALIQHERNKHATARP
ncbi:MAG: hypothetical protein ACR2M1_02690 [Gemmatimonadaceae bacterium]